MSADYATAAYPYITFALAVLGAIGGVPAIKSLRVSRPHLKIGKLELRRRDRNGDFILNFRIENGKRFYTRSLAATNLTYYYSTTDISGGKLRVSATQASQQILPPGSWRPQTLVLPDELALTLKYDVFIRVSCDEERGSLRTFGSLRVESK